MTTPRRKRTIARTLGLEVTPAIDRALDALCAANGERWALDALRAVLPPRRMRSWTLIELIAVEVCVVEGTWRRTRDVPCVPAFGASQGRKRVA